MNKLSINNDQRIFKKSIDFINYLFIVVVKKVGIIIY